MKNIFLISLFSSFAFFSKAYADSALNARCAPFVENPHVIVETTYDALKYDYSKVSKTLERLHQKEYGGNLHDGYRINGLSTYDLATSLDFNVAKKTFNDGVTCFYPTYVKLTVSVKNPMIYIARSLKKGSCSYEVALRHEQTHHQINMEVIKHYLPEIKQNFVAVVQKYKLASRKKDDIALEYVQESLQKKYLQAINPVLDKIRNEIKIEQLKLDNLENYTYEQSLCQ